MSDQVWPFIASIIYTAAWSISFYGQIYENYKYKSVQGFSLDYLIMNISGYGFYTIYSTVGFFTTVQGAGTVLPADLFFCYHAVLMVIIESVQAFIYPKGKNKISTYTFIICITLWTFMILETFLTSIDVMPRTKFWNPITCLGYGKLILSFIKYSPAVYWNYKRKSTKGWSIFNIIGDLIGGIFSLTSGGISTENGLNVAKFSLALLTIVYDLIFIFQHYVLYRKPIKQKEKDEEKVLLSDEQ